MVLALAPARHRTLIELLAGTGLRVYEALALQRRHLALDGGRPHVRVRRALRRGRIEPPKSRHGRRDVPPLARPRGPAAERDRPPDVPEALVSATRNGTALDADNLRARTIKPLMQEVGARGPRSTLRHTYASLQLARPGRTWCNSREPSGITRPPSRSPSPPTSSPARCPGARPERGRSEPSGCGRRRNGTGRCVTTSRGRVAQRPTTRSFFPSGGVGVSVLPQAHGLEDLSWLGQRSEGRLLTARDSAPRRAVAPARFAAASTCSGVEHGGVPSRTSCGVFDQRNGCGGLVSGCSTIAKASW